MCGGGIRERVGQHNPNFSWQGDIECLHRDYLCFSILFFSKRQPCQYDKQHRYACYHYHILPYQQGTGIKFRRCEDSSQPSNRHGMQVSEKGLSKELQRDWESSPFSHRLQPIFATTADGNTKVKYYTVYFNSHQPKIFM